MTTFYAVATRSTRVRVVFSEPMQQNTALVDRRQYGITDFFGTIVGVLSVAAEQVANVRSVVLELGLALVAGKFYQLKLSNIIVSSAHAERVLPDTVVFRWSESTLSTQIPIAQFSGEVSGGLYGTHGGLVFISPALEQPAPNSIIQVDQVDVCSKAYDEYHMPPQSDGGNQALMTHAGLRTLVVTTLNSGDVLWEGPSRIAVRIGVGISGTETMPRPIDGPVIASMASWPPGRISLLNNPGWKLFDNNPVSTTPYFITADNLTPLSPQAPVPLAL